MLIISRGFFETYLCAIGGKNNLRLCRGQYVLKFYLPIRFSLVAGILLLSALLQPWSTAYATPTQYGVSGLLNQPTADTLDSGNISVGLWLNGSDNSTSDGATILPVSLTMGLGSFLEAYGSFPNLLFNDEAESSGRGYANLGFKARVWGKRSSPYKLALDIQARRQISEDVDRDGNTDLVTRSIFTWKKGRFGLHANAGYSFNDDSFGDDNQVVGGAGIEYFPIARLRMIAEIEGATERISGLDSELEVMAGFQYFFSPHLTFHAGFGTGLTDTSADWRFLAGISTSQGIGTFTKPVPRIIEPVQAEQEEASAKKKSKFKTITPLLPMSRLGKPEPKIESELPVNPGEEEVVVEPENQIQVAGKVLPTALPVSPVSSPVPQKTKKDSRPEERFTATRPIKTVVYRKFRFEDVNFAFDQHSLSEAGIRSVAEVAASLRKEKKWFLIRINGHTDAIGSDDYNNKLSFRRAISVGKQLVVNEGFDPARIFIRGFGESEPLASNKSAEGRRKNRRAEILVLLPQKGE
jgi:outer membrane protein OmpA-like peptidoglycan-associated protein